MKSLKMSLKNLSVLLICSLLTSCNFIDESLNWHHFDDEITRYQETSQYGLAFGKKALYFYYGEMKVAKARAGMAYNMKEIFNYPIVELLKKYPQLRSKRSLKEAAVQYYFIQKKHPNFINPADFAELGHHGR